MVPLEPQSLVKLQENTNLSQVTGPMMQASAGTTDVSGSNGSHNNLQPYITCYMWKRTG